MDACLLLPLTFSLLLAVALALPVARNEGLMPGAQRTLDDVSFKGGLGRTVGSIIGGSVLPFQQQVEAAGFDVNDFINTVGTGIRIYDSLHPLVQAEVLKAVIAGHPKFRGPIGSYVGGLVGDWLGDAISGQQAQAEFDTQDLSNLINLGLDVYDRIRSYKQAEAASHFGFRDALDLVNTGMGIYDRFHTSEQAEAATHHLSSPPYAPQWPIAEEAESNK